MYKLQNISLTLVLSHDPNRVDKFNQRLFNICTEPAIPMDTTSEYSTTIAASQLIKMQNKKINGRKRFLLVPPNCTNQSQKPRKIGWCYILGAISWMQYLGLTVTTAISRINSGGCNILGAISWMQYLGGNISDAISHVQYLGCNNSDAISQINCNHYDISD